MATLRGQKLASMKVKKVVACNLTGDLLKL
jgi:hypothetical protein